jgi:hypothetical protein
LAGVAHDLAHHAASGLSYLSPHFAQALRAVGRATATLSLLDQYPYPADVPDNKALRSALKELRTFTTALLEKQGFTLETLPRSAVRYPSAMGQLG